MSHDTHKLSCAIYGISRTCNCKPAADYEMRPVAQAPGGKKP